MHKRNVILCGGAAVAVIATALAFTSGGSADAQGPAGCYGGALACGDNKPKAQPKAAAKGTVPQSQDLFVGYWEGQADGGTASAKIEATQAAGRYKIGGAVVSDTGCSGSLGGVGVARGNVLTLTIPAPEDSGTCRMTYTRRGGQLISDHEGCGGFHGASCDFPATMIKARPPKLLIIEPPASTKSTTQPTSAWLVGVWAPKGSYCASGDTIVFKSDNTYFSGHSLDGTWRLTGSSLQMVFTEGEDESDRGPTQRVTASLARISANEMLMDSDRLKRCPSGKGVEPWFPKMPFPD